MARYVGLGDAISDLRTKIHELRDQVVNAKSVDSKANAFAALLNAMGQLVVQYRETGQLRDADYWLDAYRRLRAEAATATAAAKPQGPSAVMLALDKFSDRALGIVNTIVQTAEKTVAAVGDVATGAGATARALPLLLPLALIAAAFVIGGGGLGRVLSVRRNPRHRRSRRRRRSHSL